MSQKVETDLKNFPIFFLKNTYKQFKHTKAFQANAFIRV